MSNLYFVITFVFDILFDILESLPYSVNILPPIPDSLESTVAMLCWTRFMRSVQDLCRRRRRRRRNMQTKEYDCNAVTQASGFYLKKPSFKKKKKFSL